jgi:hypothetical protein
MNLNSPGGYITWSIFTISEANLVLIAVMVAIFGLALLLPFPGRHEATGPGPGPGPVDVTSTGIEDGQCDIDSSPDARMWTARARRRALALLPPGAAAGRFSCDEDLARW